MPRPMRMFYPEMVRPGAKRPQAIENEYVKTYTNWAELAKLSRQHETPISLNLVIDSTSRRADWPSLKRAQHVRQLQLQLAVVLTQSLADSLLSALASWTELDAVQVNSYLQPSLATATATAPAIDGRASARLTSVHRLTFSLNGDALKAAIQTFSQCPAVYHLSVSDYDVVPRALPAELQSLKQVRSLSLFGPGTLVEVDKTIRGFPALTALQMSFTGDGQQLTDALARVPNLQKLELNVGQKQPKISGLKLGSLAKLDTLMLMLPFDKQATEPIDSVLLGVTSLRVVNLTNATLSSLDWMAANTDLRQVSLSRCRFPAAGKSLASLTKLESLSLDQIDSLQQFPAQFTQVTNLRRLSMYSCGLTAIPPSVSRMTSLTSLSLSRNKLTGLPAELGQLTALTSLNLDGNLLTTLPGSLAKLVRLTELSLSNNQLTSLPAGLGQLRRLRRLSLARNKLVTLPDDIGQCRELTSITADDNPITALPESIGTIDSLGMLTLGRTRLRTLPASIGKLTRLRLLTISGAAMTALPELIGNCQNLTILEIGDSTLATLPASLGRLTKLESLRLDLPQLGVLPQQLTGLTNLKSLMLSVPQVMILPDDLGNLSNLSRLTVASSKLVGLPNTIGRLHQLVSLQIDGKVEPITNKPVGKLEFLPDSIVRCEKLNDLTITNQLAFDGVDAIRKTARMAGLNSLNLNRCGMDRLTDIDWKTVQVSMLSLQQNSLRDVPEAILDAPNLQAVNLQYNYPLPRALNQSFWSKELLKTAFVEAQLATKPLATDKPDARIMQAYMNAGMRQMQQRNWGEVFANLEKAILVAPDTLKALPLAQRAELYLFRKEYASAVADYEQAIAGASRLKNRSMGIDPVMAQAMMTAQWWGRMGTARSSLGQYDKALADLDKALALLPKTSNPPIRANFYTEQAKINANRNKLDAAKANLDSANAVYAAMPYAGQGERLTEVELAILTNQPDKATAALSKFRKQFPAESSTGRMNGLGIGGYNTLYEYLSICTALLKGTQTPDQGIASLTTYLKTTPEKIYNWSFDLFDTMLPRLGLPAEKATALSTLTKMTKEQAAKVE